MHDKPEIFLVDVSGFIFRAYYAIRSNLTNSKGQPTNAVFGVAQMLTKLIEDVSPRYLGLVFDVSRRSFRTELFPDYKGHRPDPPEDLVPQFALIQKLAEAMGLKILEKENYEADDLLGTLARRFSEAGHPVRIVTSDKDLMQLVNERVTLLDTWKNKSIGIEDVKERFGVEPEKVIEVLGLAGDSSDNVPGVPGVGEKTAIQLIQEFGSIEGVLSRIDEVKGKKRKENLQTYAEQARLSKTLVTIDTEVDFPLEPEDIAWNGPATETLAEFYKEMEFTRLAASLETTEAATVLDRDAYVLVDERAAFDSLLKRLGEVTVCAFDTETRSKVPFDAGLLVGVSFSPADGESYYLPVDHEGAKHLEKQEVLDALRPFFEDPARTWIAQNAKFDMEVLRTEGVEIRGRIDDSMLLSYVLDPSRRAHGLDALALSVLGHTMISFEEICGKGKKQITFDKVDTTTATRYAAEDSDATWRIFHKLRERVEKENLYELYETIERPLVPVLARMEGWGVRVDRDKLEELSRDFEGHLERFQEKIWAEAGEEFLINSPQQLQRILFDKLGMKPLRKTSTGYSTDQSVLEKLALYHDLPQLILDYRTVAKLKSTYTEALVRLIHPDTGRIHTSYNQTVAMTGRLSSSEPNLQNIPVRTEQGRMIRAAFVPDPGHKLLCADYSQVELRIMAHLAQDPLLLESFQNGEDVHSRTAAEIFGGFGGITPELRRRAKAINFGLMYGKTPHGLSEELGISRAEAKRFIDDYFLRYHGVKAWMERQQEQGREEGVVYTLFGRRVPLPEIHAKNAQRRGYAERVAINAPIQGTSADIIKRAMATIDRRLHDDFSDVRMIMQVHDELVFEVPESRLDATTEMVRELMEGAAALDVPLTVDLGVGDNWDEAH